jgi:hypothetical protein
MAEFNRVVPALKVSHLQKAVDFYAGEGDVTVFAVAAGPWGAR